MEKKQKTYSDLSRRDIRSLLFQLLYAAEGHNYESSLDAIVDTLNRAYSFTIPLDSEVVVNAQQIIDQRDALDEKIKPLLQNWRLDRVSVIAKLILRIALWELQQGNIDPIIVINEAVELAKCFAEKDAYKFINGVLDEYVKEHMR